jgi:hypothetical protein
MLNRLLGGGMERTGVNAMKIVEVRGKTEPLDGAFNIFFDVSGRVGHLAGAEDIETAF